MTLDEAIRLGDLVGYAQRAPSATCAAEDAALIAEWDCVSCGHRGLTYRPFSKPGSYRLFLVCRHCSAAEEV